MKFNQHITSTNSYHQIVLLTCLQQVDTLVVAPVVVRLSDWSEVAVEDRKSEEVAVTASAILVGGVFTVALTMTFAAVFTALLFFSADTA